MWFRRTAIVSLAWSLLVIIWGAYVRASGSGAGCGAHWPVCNGDLIPRAPSVQTLIEYTHRATSGIALLLVIAVFVMALRQPSRVARRFAILSLVLMLTEAALGALLVKAELVADNATASRAVAMSIHLINTFLLVGVMVMTVFHAFAGDVAARLRGSAAVFSWLAMVLVMVTGVSGAIAALGDTLTQQAVQSAFVDLLIRLRIIHPFLALATAAVLLNLGRVTFSATRGWTIALWSLVVLQLMAGLTNVVLQAPVWMQLVHLGLADAVWVTVLVATRKLAVSAAR
jgi:cytochrome c oxidase assembly protein subunit 15/protoheme IX farnesyltransferase